jgi:hypothetical protein
MAMSNAAFGVADKLDNLDLDEVSQVQAIVNEEN